VRIARASFFGNLIAGNVTTNRSEEQRTRVAGYGQFQVFEQSKSYQGSNKVYQRGEAQL
jgi:hypothetical protein